MNRHPRSAARALLVCAWMVAAVAPAARANVQSFYGAGVRGPALANALTAGAWGPDATLYNPAALARPGPAVLDAGVAFFRLDLEAGAAGRSGEDVLNASAGLSTPVPFGGILEDRVFFGVFVHLPTEGARLSRIYLPSESEPYFLPYTNATERVVVTPGLALELADGVAIGFSLDIFPFDSPNLQVGRVGALGSFELDGDLSLLADYVPRAGLWLDGDGIGGALEGWELGFTFRESFDAEFSLPAALDVGFPVSLEVSGVTGFVPRLLSVGAAWRASDSLELFGELAWQQWSRLSTPRIRLSVSGLDQLVPVDALASIATDTPDPDLHDTLSPRVAGEWTTVVDGASLTGRLGYAFEPSPGTPRGDPMLFTNPRHVLTGGFGAGTDLEVDGSTFTVHGEVFLQAHVLESQRRTRPTPVGEPPPEPAVVTGGGWVGVAGAYLEVHF